MHFDYEVEIVTSKDPDNSAIAYDFYQYAFPWYAQLNGMRGDTLCSFSTSYGKCNRNPNKPLEPLVDGRSWKRGYTATLFVSPFRKTVQAFRHRYHSLANFGVMPTELNQWRGLDSTQGDYFDIFLSCVRSFYLEGKKSLSQNVSEKFSAEDVQSWFNYFGKGNEGWVQFAEENVLTPFLTPDYQVKDLLCPSEQYFSSDAPLVGSYHNYGRPFPWQVEASSPDQRAEYVKNYTKNSLWIFRERARLLRRLDY